jgi:hypothetical protein
MTYESVSGVQDKREITFFVPLQSPLKYDKPSYFDLKLSGT